MKTKLALVALVSLGTIGIAQADPGHGNSWNAPGHNKDNIGHDAHNGEVRVNHLGGQSGRGPAVESAQNTASTAGSGSSGGQVAAPEAAPCAVGCTQPPASAPEIDPASASTALALLMGGLAVIRGRRRAQG